jgi:uncharacterized membrane protein YhaH (DUF805 family)
MVQIEPQARRLAPLPFLFGTLAVYALSFASQVLLSPPVTARFSVAPFVLAQAMLIGCWLWLHVRRLRDAGRGGGLAVGIATVYALEVVLFTLLIWLILSSAGTTNDGAGSEAPILHLFVVLYFLSLMTGDPGLGALQAWMTGFLVLLALPVAIGVVFSLWTATRPRAAVRP